METLQDPRAGGNGHPFQAQHIFDRHGDARQRRKGESLVDAPAGKHTVGAARLLERPVGGDVQEGTHRGIVALDAFEASPGQIERADLTGPEQRRGFEQRE